MILIAGDIHGNWASLNKLISQQQPKLILQCGDFGYWLSTWCILPGHFDEEIEIAKQVAEDFDRRYPFLGILSMPSEWWQI